MNFVCVCFEDFKLVAAEMVFYWCPVKAKHVPGTTYLVVGKHVMAKVSSQDQGKEMEKYISFLVVLRLLGCVTKINAFTRI